MPSYGSKLSDRGDPVVFFLVGQVPPYFQFFAHISCRAQPGPSPRTPPPADRKPVATARLYIHIYIYVAETNHKSPPKREHSSGDNTFAPALHKVNATNSSTLNNNTFSTSNNWKWGWLEACGNGQGFIYIYTCGGGGWLGKSSFRSIIAIWHLAHTNSVGSAGIPSSILRPWTRILHLHTHPAAESMLQHSRSARSSSQALNGFAMPESYPLDTSQAQARMNRIAAEPIQLYSHFRHPFQSTSVQEQSQGFGPEHAIQAAGPVQSSQSCVRRFIPSRHSSPIWSPCKRLDCWLGDWRRQRWARSCTWQLHVPTRDPSELTFWLVSLNPFSPREWIMQIPSPPPPQSQSPMKFKLIDVVLLSIKGFMSTPHCSSI